MSATLFEYEWQFLLQMLTRINYCESYEQTCATLLQQIQTLIPFQTGIMFQAGRRNGRAVLTNPISNEQLDDRQDHAFFTEGDYPHWNEFIMAPYSMVFRQSDIIPPLQWEKTRVYREVWQKKNIFWGLFISLVCKDHPLAVIGLLREKSDADFSSRDTYIMHTIKDPLERKYYSLIEPKPKRGSVVQSERILRLAAEHGLTKRETEIVALVCKNTSSEEICQQLFITHATLSKHLSNIYAKTRQKNRTQLFGLFSE